MSPKEMAEKTAAAVRKFVGAQIGVISKRIDQLAERVAAIPTAEKGADGTNGVDGKDGVDGIDGIDGRDALGIEIVEIEETRSYPRGTYAAWRGGLIRSIRRTSPLDGSF